MYIGAHLDSEKTLLKTLNKLHTIFQGNALQFFTKSPVVKKPADIHKYDTYIDDILDFCKKHQVQTVIHSAYTINIASPLLNNKRKIDLIDTYWYQNVVNDLIIAHKLGSIGTIIHVGKYTTNNPDDSLNNMIHFVSQIIKFIDENNLNTSLIIETAAGQGSEMLVDIDEFIDFYKIFNRPDVLKLCFDTAHVWASGYDITQSYQKIQENTNNAIAVVHMNGSKFEKGSKKDRHESIFQGYIPIQDINNLMKIITPNSVIILETPNDDKNEIKFLFNSIK